MADDFKIEFSFSVEEQLRRATRLLGGAEDAARKVASRAINRALRSAGTAGTRSVTSKYTVKSTRVRQEIAYKPMGKEDDFGAVVVKGKRLTAASFKFTPRAYNRWTRPVQLEVIKGSKRTPKGAFVASPNRTPVIFERGGTSPSGIRALQRLSVPQMMQSGEAVEMMQKAAEGTLSKRVAHELQRELQRRAK